LRVHGLTPNRDERRERVINALEDAGLKPAEDYLHRFPHQLSGGQRQRVVIAGALVLEPHLLLADEPVSMLDVSIRAEIINLLADLRRTRGISVIFITHDLGTVGFLQTVWRLCTWAASSRSATMREVLKDPKHPYTQALLSVIPGPQPAYAQEAPDPAG
jgi:peptide/nickel transport system ATP-binding protein